MNASVTHACSRAPRSVLSEELASTISKQPQQFTLPVTMPFIAARTKESFSTSMNARCRIVILYFVDSYTYLAHNTQQKDATGSHRFSSHDDTCPHLLAPSRPAYPVVVPGLVEDVLRLAPFVVKEMLVHHTAALERGLDRLIEEFAEEVAHYRLFGA